MPLLYGLAQAVNRDSQTGQQLPAGGGSSGLRKGLDIGAYQQLGPGADGERGVAVHWKAAL